MGGEGEVLESLQLKMKLLALPSNSVVLAYT